MSKQINPEVSRRMEYIVSVLEEVMNNFNIYRGIFVRNGGATLRDIADLCKDAMRKIGERNGKTYTTVEDKVNRGGTVDKVHMESFYNAVYNWLVLGDSTDLRTLLERKRSERSTEADQKRIQELFFV